VPDEPCPTVLAGPARTPAQLGILDGAGWARTVTVGVRIPPPPAAAHQLQDTSSDRPRGAMSSRYPPSCARFDHSGRWGTSMPVTRDGPSLQGDVPGPDPARAPPNKAIAQAGSLVGQPAGVSPGSQGSAMRSAAAPHERDVPGPCLGHTPRNRAVLSGHQRYVVLQVTDEILPIRPECRALIRMRSSGQVCDRSADPVLRRERPSRRRPGGPGSTGEDTDSTRPRNCRPGRPDRPRRTDCC
jgi:hypothetical protein